MHVSRKQFFCFERFCDRKVLKWCHENYFLCLLLKQLLYFRLLIPFVQKHKSQNFATYFVRQQATVAGFAEYKDPRLPHVFIRRFRRDYLFVFIVVLEAPVSPSGVCCMPVTMRSLSMKFGFCILKTLSCSSRLPALYVTTLCVSFDVLERPETVTPEILNERNCFFVLTRLYFCSVLMTTTGGKLLGHVIF